jgi:hypothetical protein
MQEDTDYLSRSIYQRTKIQKEIEEEQLKDSVLAITAAFFSAIICSFFFWLVWDKLSPEIAKVITTIWKYAHEFTK